jgi:hypothetical protein
MLYSSVGAIHRLMAAELTRVPLNDIGKLEMLGDVDVMCFRSWV